MNTAFRIGILSIANAVLGFLVTTVLARTLGASDFGIYSSAFVIASSLAIIVQFGLPNLIMRETAYAASEKDWAQMMSVWKWAARHALVLSVIIMSTVGLTVVVFWFDNSLEQAVTYLLATLLVPLTAFGALRAGALKGLQHVVLAQIPEFIIKPGAMLLMAVSLGVILPARPDVAMTMQVLAVLISFAAGVFLLWLKLPQGAIGIGLSTTTAAMPSFRSVMAFALVAGATRINQYADILTISAFRSSQEVGVYRAMWQLSLLVSFGIGIAGLIVAPLFARFHRNGDRDAIFRTLRQARLLGVAIALPSLIVVLFAGEHVVRFLFGHEFVLGMSALLVLVTIQAMNAVAGPLGILLNMTGHEAISSRYHLFTAGLNIILNLVFVPMWGMSGAAYATFGSYLFLNSALIMTASKRVRTS